MQIASLFKKDITRAINGVVKADQLDEQCVWQELDEFVVTNELDKYFHEFFDQYCEAIDNPKDPNISNKIGVWISGFFGSGKSHFLKVLSYLLANKPHSFEGETKNAVDFFENKISDAMLFANVKRAVTSNTDVILFNIDSKAPAGIGREAILAVFLNVFNELTNYSGDHPHIAHMERYLDKEGKLEDFHEAYRSAAGAEWVDERDAYHFNRDQVVQALSTTIGQSEESCVKWLDGSGNDFSLTVENFAKWVKAYLDKQGPDNRIIFLVDEVGQFIGQDTHLMLNLQTITEELGTVCNGRAWVVVTSQEDIDAVVGDMNQTRANDFSKITGRFKTRLSLSSNNVDEVIQKRLLTKADVVKPELEELYASKGDVLKNQLTFRDIGTTFKSYEGVDDFISSYPFAPYQFKLLQRIFESIRKAGATGLHLAQGERSLLDAFQSAGMAVENKSVGILVPLYLFYPSIESFLDTSVKRTIDQAVVNSSLVELDAKLLQVLFLIRYVDEIKGNVDNLVTLCLDQIDADRLALKRKIEEGLIRLEKETLISRSGDNYFFLTDEERDVSREIKSVDLHGNEEAKLMGELIFEDVFKGQRKHRFSVNKMDFSLNRFCDLHPVGNRVDNGLSVSVVTPLMDDYQLYNDGKCIGVSGEENGQILIRLEDDNTLGRELRAYLKTDKYLRTHDDGTLPATTRKIHRDLADENRHRREVLMSKMKELMLSAKYYIAGQTYPPSGATASTVLHGALEYLVANTFNKMGLLAHLRENPLIEIQSLLRTDDVAQAVIDVEFEESNPQAIENLRNHLALCTTASRKIILHDLLNIQYYNRPYGWPPLETLLLLTRLYVSGEIQFLLGNEPKPRTEIYGLISVTNKWRNITIIQRVTAAPRDLKKARELSRNLFSELGPESEDKLFEFLVNNLNKWFTELTNYKTLAESRKYPGIDEITEALGVLKLMLNKKESNVFIKLFIEKITDLEQIADNYHDLSNFYGTQKSTWDKLMLARDKFSLNNSELIQNAQAEKALLRMNQILETPAPYSLIHEVEGLIQAVSVVNVELLEVRRTTALQVIDEQIDLVAKDLNDVEADQALENNCLHSLHGLKTKVQAEQSIAHLVKAEIDAVNYRDQAADKINDFISRRNDEASDDTDSDAPVLKKTKVVYAEKFTNKTFLETSEDVKEFIKELSDELETAIANDERIEIR